MRRARKLTSVCSHSFRIFTSTSQAILAFSTQTQRIVIYLHSTIGGRPIIHLKIGFSSALYFLSQELRKEINDLVVQLNKVIYDATVAANQEHGGDHVHYVDVDPGFDGHRWCESNDIQEPDANRPETYFFLSAWNDMPISGVSTTTTAAAESAELASFEKSGEIPLPATDCGTNLNIDADPYIRWMCRLTNDLRADSKQDHNVWAVQYKEANAHIKNGTVSAQHVSYFTPTRQIKTFHPRSPGMLVYRDAVLKSINEH